MRRAGDARFTCVASEQQHTLPVTRGDCVLTYFAVRGSKRDLKCGTSILVGSNVLRDQVGFEY